MILFQNMNLKCNDHVIFGKYSGTEITIKNKDYLNISLEITIPSDHISTF
mgnify:CR=1 FL=1